MRARTGADAASGRIPTVVPTGRPQGGLRLRYGACPGNMPWSNPRSRGVLAAVGPRTHPGDR
ncbi:hypothetical protein SSCG_06119 [Streptomyces clavuligerus]|nr:hypothetical protein SSCG_06119 [Streptomyces clavuligerus]